MKEDIEFHIAEQVQVVAIREWDKDFLNQNWNVYLLNLRMDTIETVLVMSRGNSEDKKTSVLRHGLGDMESNTSAKVELITDEVLGFTNEYLVTFFAEGKLFERRFVFNSHTISEENSIHIPMLDTEGIRAV
ncbi:hypothetical protein [Constantimarinum furrinae]|uniref:Uncharacterized protein n=1 Tax=Constantimarinum furrinae TaxID=2562285 RepID=A0A7G8PTE7_9FLAO|nr:hypothetical protein [Constantimarinum furrinae]QNJ97613.1 hypothetical protein ALE3EI_1040 [Constantimarinum furrinae]